MPVIVFMLDHKEGHLLPSFKLAHSLKAQGHDIIYLGIIDNEEMVMAQGFRFYPLFQDIYPAGFNQDNKKLNDAYSYNDERVKIHISKIIRGALDDFMALVEPDLFIVHVFLGMEALLLHYKYNATPVMVTTYLREKGNTFAEECLNILFKIPGDAAMEIVDFVSSRGFRFTSLRDLLQPVNNFHELVLCPEEFYIDKPVENNHVHYIGPSIFCDRAIGDKPYPELMKHEGKLIYASLGSYAIMYGSTTDHFFYNIVRCMEHEEMADYHLILSIGKEFDATALDPVPENVTVMKWVSQIDVLKSSALVITHGGLGTIKESVFYGVPMIVFPMRYDQNHNASLVDYHELGISRKIDNISTESLRTDMLYVLNNNNIKEKVKRMQMIFRDKEEAEYGTGIIQQLLTETNHQVPKGLAG